MAERSADGLREAIVLFEQVISADSTRAEAYAGLAKAYVLQAYYSGTPPFIAYPAGREAAQKALELDNLAAEAHAALGLVKRDFDWNWEGAEESFERAIRLDPQSGTSHQWYAELLVAQGRYAEAMERIDQAIEAEPLSLTARAVRGWILICAGRLGEAHTDLEATRARDPEFPLSHWWLGQLYVQRGAFDQAITSLERAVELAGSSRMVADLAAAYALAGQTSESRLLLAELGARSGNASVSQYEYAVVYAALGDDTRAFYELAAAMRERTWQVVNMGIDPMLGSVRLDERYQALLEQLNLPVTQ
jgi:tetratricopeptide (TPR) repeat protein